MSNKITAVDLLEDGQLEVSVLKGSAQKTITIPKSEFIYG